MKKILILTALALSVASCGKTEEVKNTAPASAPSNTIANTAPADAAPVKDDVFTAGENPKGDVFYSTKKQLSAPVWSVTVTSETAMELNMLMEHVAPDRYYVKQPEGEVIVIGKNSYVNRNGSWEKAGVDLSEMISSQSKLVTEQALQNIKDVKKIGAEPFKGKEAIIYSYKNKDDKSDEETTTTVWVDKATGLPLKIHIEGEVNGTLQKISSVYDYEKPVKIEAPKIN